MSTDQVCRFDYIYSKISRLGEYPNSILAIISFQISTTKFLIKKVKDYILLRRCSF